MSKKKLTRLCFKQISEEYEFLSAVTIMQLYLQTEPVYTAEFLKQVIAKPDGDYVTVQATTDELSALIADAKCFGFSVTELPILITP